MPAARPHAVVIEGEPGIGKTSLWREGVAIAREHGLRVLTCRPSGAEAHLSLAALGDLLHEELDAVLPTLPPPQRRALEAALVLADPVDPDSDYRTLGVGVLGALRARGAVGAFVVAIDDLQWLDAPSARVLEFALRRLDRVPMTLLASLRTGDASLPPFDLEQAFAVPPERIPLGSLSLGALRELLRRRTGLTPSRPSLKRLHATTRGNPFYALEIARALERRDEAELASLPLTETLREIVQRRWRGMPAKSRETLLAAAALSRPTISTLAAWAGSEERVIRDLERARGAGIIELDDDERIDFTHPLFAAGVYAESGIADRRRVHGQLARVVSDSEERARHLARTAGGPDASVVAALRDAADVARARRARRSARAARAGDRLESAAPDVRARKPCSRGSGDGAHRR